MFHENWIDKLNFEEIRECIKNVSLLEIVSENVKPNDVHSLPNGKILFITSNLVSILDENFNIIKSKEMMGVVGCALKDENEIYLVDSINSCIYIIDSELEKKMQLGSYGIGDYQFKNPKTIFWVNELFYVNDDGNFRIQIFDKNQKFLNSVENNNPFSSIKISEKSIAIPQQIGLQFIDLLTLEKRFHDDRRLNGKLHTINSCFYIVSNKFGKLIFLDEFEKYSEEINLETLFSQNELNINLEDWKDMFFFSHKRNLFLYIGNKIHKLIFYI
jgi:hypothetical protein